MYRQLPRTESNECLGNMTPETQDIYLRMDHHRRRSGYRLGRIIARQQLLKRIAADSTLMDLVSIKSFFFLLVFEYPVQGSGVRTKGCVIPDLSHTARIDSPCKDHYHTVVLSPPILSQWNF
ncbi:unnamed protein product [Leuciscus chuanchicus]